MHLINIGYDFAGEGQFIFGPSAFCTEGGGFGAHSKFGPEAGQENYVRELQRMIDNDNKERRDHPDPRKKKGAP